MEDSDSKKATRSDSSKIDALPDEVLYDILAFLDMKEVIATSLVSRRWRYLWESVPVLNFEHKEHADEDNEIGKKGFMNFVDRVLLLRDGSKVKKFKIICAYDDLDRLRTWLTVAARKQFQEIHIGLYADNLIDMPDFVLSSTTVLNLVVDINRVKIPCSVCSSPQLKTLILDFVKLPEGDSKGELMFNCPVLENLVLKYCDQSHLIALIISTPQLKSLVIENPKEEYDDHSHTKIQSPNLVSLEWNCSWENSYSFSNFANLVNAKIVCIDDGLPNAHNLAKVLDAISCATTIEVSLEKVPKDMPNKLNSQFSNVRHLMLKSKIGNRSFIRLVLKLLKNAPSVETLDLDVIGMKDFEEEVSPFMLCHLKSVSIWVLKGYENVVKILEVLLKISIVLEELVIRMTARTSIQAKVNFGQQIRSLARASPSLAVIVV